MTWRNWTGNVKCTPAQRYLPRDVDDVVRVIRDRAPAGGIRVVGSGHSFTPLAATSGTLLSLDHLSGLVSVGAQEATVLAGTKLRTLGPLLEQQGLGMENMGDIDAQSLAGAISTGTHGTGAALGNLSSQVVGLTLVTAAGDVLECSPSRDADVFDAARLSLGALGVIVRVTLRLQPAYRLRYRSLRAGFEAAAADVDALRTGHRHFELYWFPFTETVQLKITEPTDEAPRNHGFGRWLNDLLLENAAFGLMSRACRAAPALCRPASRLAAALVGEGTRVDASWRIFATQRMVRFMEMEYALPADAGIPALRELKTWLDASDVAVHFPVELRYVKGDDIPLSPSYGRDTAYVAVHMYAGMPFRPYFDAAERIFRGHGGRPHWGKWHGLAADDLRPLYPRWDAFQDVRRRLDPGGVFMTPYLRQLLEAAPP